MRRKVSMDARGMIEIEFIITENGELGIRRVSRSKERVAEQLQAFYGEF
jgi:hypothetical protein